MCLSSFPLSVCLCRLSNQEEQLISTTSTTTAGAATVDIGMDGQGSRRNWLFKVEAATAPGELVCLTGSCTELGSWDPNLVVPLALKEAAQGENE